MQNFVPVLPDTAPFTLEQRAYLNGFLAGLCSRAPLAGAASTPAATAPAPQALAPLTILFGSQTGTAEGLAKKLAKEAGKRGFVPTVLDMSQIDLGRLAAEKNLLVITSTYGDGEPPDNAKALWTALGNAEGTPLASLHFSVCGLGDTNYVQFCKCAKDFDARLEKLGGKRFADRVDCDVDYDEKFTRWMDGALGALGQAAPAGAAPAPAPVAAATASVKADSASAEIAESSYSRKNPYSAVIRASRVLNGDGSAKEVRHVEFETADLAYEAGDALGVFPQNCPELVAEILGLLGCDGEEAVALTDGTTTSLRHALTVHYDLGRPSPEFVSEFALRRSAPAASSLDGGTATAIAPHHVIDVLHAHADVKLTPAEFVAKLKRIQPRLYSISSSPLAHRGRIHLTVGAVRYDLHGKARKGVCSTYLADRVTVDETRVGVFVHSNKAFRPPAKPDVPMIMVGPGTGIAPFRAFLHERRARGATGKNWLFFGDQRAATDFLYREELSQLQAEGVLTKLDTAFSRDQTEKIYVQNRMLENAAELFAWLETGAHLYVCGDASRMAKDVDAALHKIIEIAGKKTPDQAAAYVDQLKAGKRYARDVY